MFGHFIFQMKATDLIEASNVCSDVQITAETKSRVLSKEEGLKKILDIEIGIQLKPEQWTRILEQLVLFVLILGRLLLPKGKLSRDQFSQLMLVYLGMQCIAYFKHFKQTLDVGNVFPSLHSYDRRCC